MRYFAARGRFWLPQQPRRAVHGGLTFDEDGIRLELADSLRAPVARASGVVGGSPERAAEPVVHGRTAPGRPTGQWACPARRRYAGPAPGTGRTLAARPRRRQRRRNR